MDGCDTDSAARANLNPSRINPEKIMSEESKIVMDVAAGGVTVASFLSYLPEISAGLSIIWLSLRIYETVREMYLRD